MKYASKQDIRVIVKGDLSQFRKHGYGEYAEKFRKLERETRNNKGFTLTYYVNYNAHNDLQRAFRKALTKTGGKVKIADVLRHMDQPEKLDVILRTGTSGRRRLSGFIPIRDPNTHLMFVRQHFPNITPQIIKSAIQAHRKRVINEGR